MSGCGCGQPVIISGPAAQARVNVEPVLLCDVLPSGEVAGVALVESVYDASSGARIGTRTVDPATGQPYTLQGELGPCATDGCNATVTSQMLCDTAPDGTVVEFQRSTTFDCRGQLLGTLDRALDGQPYTPAGTVGLCPTTPDCASPTTPTATVGLCLADGTPIAVTVTRDCDGAVTSEGWINLTTGAWSTGVPPAGTVACGDTRSIQVSGTFCDIDEATGDVLGLVLVEYTYGEDGAITSVRLVDAATGQTYIPTGTVTVCPSGVEQPERDLVQLCDTATDGTVTPFVRDYARDENGAIVGHSDYLVDGTAYTPTGTVGVCAEPCRNSTTVLVCDAPADSTTTITPTIVDGVTADVGQTQFQNHPGPYTDLWSGGTFLYPAGAGPAQEHLTATGQLTADMADCDGASGTVTISVRVRNDGPDDGQAWDGALRLFRGTTLLASQNALEWAPPGWQGTLTVSAPVTAADIAAGDIRVALTLETYHLGAKSWTADQFTAALELEGCEVTSSTQFLRTLVADCTTGEVVSTVDTTLDGQPYTVTGEVGQCTPASGGSSSDCRDCQQLVLCDVTPDGTNTFLRAVCRDCTGALLSTLDTALDGATPYAVAGTVGACATPPAECEAAAVTTLRLCDLNPEVQPDAQGRRCAVPFLRHLVHDCTGALTESRDTTMDGTTPYTPVAVVDCGTGGVPAQVELQWPQTGIAEDPAGGGTRQDFIYTVTNPDNGETAEVRLHTSSPASTACAAGGVYDPSAPVFNNPTVYTLALDAVAQQMTVFRLDFIDLDTWEGISQLNPPPDRVEGDVTWNGTTITANANNTTAYAYWDSPPAQISYRQGNTGGGLACTAVSFQGTTLKAEGCCGCEPPGQEPCTRTVIERCGCDDTTGDGIGDVTYTELWAVDPCNGEGPVLLGTYEDGDFSRPYVPVAPAECTAADQPPGSLSTGVRAVTGTAAQDIAGAFPGLQSVTVTVLAGAVTATMSDGAAVPLPAGVTMTWSVVKDEDSALAAASFTGAAASAQYLLNYTYR